MKHEEWVESQTTITVTWKCPECHKQHKMERPSGKATSLYGCKCGVTVMIDWNAFGDGDAGVSFFNPGEIERKE